MDKLPLLSLLVFSPLLGMIILLCIPNRKGQWIKAVGISASALPLFIIALMLFHHAAGTLAHQFEEKYEWIQISLHAKASYTISYHLALDGLTMPLLLLTVFISFISAFSSIYIKKRWKMFYMLFLLLQIGLLGAFTARDIFLFLSFTEVSMFAVYFMIGIWGSEKRERTANLFLLFQSVGSMLLLLAMLILVHTAGGIVKENSTDSGFLQSTMVYSSDMSVIAENLDDDVSHKDMDLATHSASDQIGTSSALKWTMFLLFFIAFTLKLSLFPFHSWMIKLYQQAPFAVGMITSGALLKIGAYGLLRFAYSLFPEYAEQSATIVAVVGMVSVMYGAVLAFVNKAPRTVLSYTSLSLLGMAVASLASGYASGALGGMMQLISHGLIFPLFILLLGSLYERLSYDELYRTGGMARSMPFMSGLLLLAAFAVIGIPGLAGFVSMWLSFLGLFAAWPLAAILCAIAILLMSVAVLRTVLALLFGDGSTQNNSLKDARFIEAVPMMFLTGFLILLGIYPLWLTDMIKPTIESIMGLGG